ncbi:MAG: hypothetical protein PVG03_01195 [Desulfarculaceae bacterium]
MAQTLGILVTSDRYMDHLLGICRAAGQADKDVKIFLTHRGVLLSQAPEFAALQEMAHISLCRQNYQAFGLQDEAAPVPEEDFTTQARHALLLSQCDRYLVL